jgi:hypothetical protein
MTSEPRRALPLSAVPRRWRREPSLPGDGATGADNRPSKPGEATPELNRELRRPSTLVLLGAAALLGVGLMWALQDALIDDSYISLEYARTLAFHGDWGPLPGLPSNTATSPLNVMLLAALTLAVRSPMAALWIVTVLNAVVLAIGLVRLGVRWRVGPRLAWIATPLLLLNPLLASSIGLETMLVVTAFVWMLESAVAGNGRTFGWLTGLGIVLRPDVVLVAGVVWLMHPALRRPHAVRATLGVAWRAALLGLPWYVFSWFYFGSAIPDTLVIKQNQAWGSFFRGLWERYHDLYPEATNAVFLVGGLGLAALLATPLLVSTKYRPVVHSVMSAGVAGLVYFGAYWLLDVPPYFWYYAATVAGLTLVLSFAIAVATDAVRRRPGQSRALGVVLVAAILTPALMAWNIGLADHAPLREAPIHGNWALTPEYKQIGLDLAERLPPGAIVRSAGEFGTILYYCECTLIDRLDQRGLIMKELVNARKRSLPMRLNYLWLDRNRYPVLEQDYHLVYRRGSSDQPDDWNVWNPTKGNGYYTLRPGPRPQDVAAGLVP